MDEMDHQARALSSGSMSAGNFGQMLSDLTRPQAFPFALADKETIAPAIALISALAAPAQGALHLVRVVKSAEHQHFGWHDQPPEETIEQAKQNMRETVERLHDEFEGATTGR